MCKHISTMGQHRERQCHTRTQMKSQKFIKTKTKKKESKPRCKLYSLIDKNNLQMHQCHGNQALRNIQARVECRTNAVESDFS